MAGGGGHLFFTKKNLLVYLKVHIPMLLYFIFGNEILRTNLTCSTDNKLFIKPSAPSGQIPQKLIDDIFIFFGIIRR